MIFRILTGAFLWMLIVSVPSISTADTTFNASTIVGVDQSERTITFKTREGTTWTLPVSDPKILQIQVARGDQVSIEIDLSDRIIKMTKLSESSPSAADQIHDDVKP
ncbi:exported protein of unknown function [Nitrospira sp. KM1]|uniref:hypothetical protein n=1 Tax=Nitrospira sp. KM1 TaxID=1936990 RepID=UPI0013A7AE62|nr:hypothetical protein [Nitrospira sp. KM1]BCA52970.1 exported protein of unknown function [Nitrospira sp. KM1]